MAERTSHEVETGVPFTVDAEGYVLVDGARVHGADHVRPVRVGAAAPAAEVSCQLCKATTYRVPTELRRRFETARGFDRLFYWFGLVEGYPRACPDCRAKEAATP